MAALLAVSVTAVSADGNHDAPNFDEDSMTMTVREDIPAGTSVGEVPSATDQFG